MDGTRATIYLDNLNHNIKALKAASGNRRFCLAVKADAYGHGAVEISRAAAQTGVESLGVARIAEARQLRSSGINLPILLFSAFDLSDAAEIVELDIQPFVSSIDAIKALSAAANRKKPAAVHLKIDTGMGRIGCTPEQAVHVARYCVAEPEIMLEGIATHYPLADNPDDLTARGQIRDMADVRAMLEAEGIRPRYYHAANSGGIFFHADDGMDMVRPGISAYGYSPDRHFAEALTARGISLKPVMELSAPVTFVKKVARGQGISYGHIWHAPEDCWIATINCGYADGYPRLSSGHNSVRIRGRDYPQVGRICMDQCMVNLGSDNPGVSPGDRALLFGPDGPEDADSIADHAQTISYEITCGITSRVPREYSPSTAKS